MKVRNFKAVHKALEDYIARSPTSGRTYRLDRMRGLMDYLGSPQDSYKVIHVAGTSGKSSTCYYLAAMLVGAGKRVGLSVSPHVDEVNERVQLDMEPLEESRYCREFSIFLELVEKSGIIPTYFEILVAFAFWEFARANVNYAVIEVGLGGLLDGTNVISREDKVCVITDIGLDHIEVLGDTLAKIAAQKAGIIHEYNHVFSYAQNREVMEVLEAACQDKNAVLHAVDQSPENKLPQELPLFQRRNWHLARAVFKYTAECDALANADSAAEKGSAQTHIPARMETVVYKGKTLIMDGAHNAQKLEALAMSIRASYPGKAVAVLTSFVNTKQSRLREDLEVLLPFASRLITTRFDTPGSPRHSVDPRAIANICRELGYKNYYVFDDPQAAFLKLMDSPEQILLVTGSFYLLNHIRPLVLKTK